MKFHCSECRLASGVSPDVAISSSSTEQIVCFGNASSCRSDTDMFCQNFILNYRKDGNKDAGDDNGSSDAEDFEVHIDLTDDLLHMVSFCFSPLPLTFGIYFCCLRYKRSYSYLYF